MSTGRSKRRSTGNRQAAARGEGVPEVDPGPPYVLRWHPSAEAERDSSWPVREQVAMRHAAEKLEAAGPRLGHPHSSAVRGERGRGLRELRPRAGRSRWRPIYRRIRPSTFVVLAVGPEAGIDSRGYDQAVARALARFEQLDAE